MSVEIIDTPAPSPPPAPTSEIHVEPQPIDTGPQQDAPKPGSARARMFENLRSRAKNPDEVEASAKPKAPAKAERPGADEEEVEAKAPGAKEEKPAAEVPADVKDKPMSAEEKKKVNPWKLVDQYKAQTSKLEKEISDLRTSAVPQKEREELNQKLQKIEARNKELEDHIRFVDYSKSNEFKQQFDDPYEKAWVMAMKDLNELTVDDGQGGQRALQAQDILDLVNLPLAKARELADETYGPFADDVMAHRKEIRNLFEARSQALEDAKKNGAERIRQNIENYQKHMGEIGNMVKETWNSANESIVRDEKYGLYFTPIEGDENVNQRLAKGYALVDRAFSENPNDPKLTADERRAIVKRHAAVRNRAAAFGRLIYDLGQAKSKINSLTEELKKYRGSEPPSGGGAKSNGGEASGHPTSTRESIFANLRARAH